MNEPRPWHRLFALALMDFFRGMPVTVEPEKDLSVKRQFLDVLLIHKETGKLLCRLPDGFGELTTYTLITFKSFQEKLSLWALQELLGHYVNLRKQVSPSMNEEDLLPEEEFQLYAVCARYPQQLMSSNVVLTAVSQGVYEVQALGKRIRIIVANQLPKAEANAMLLLFSTNAELLAYAVQHYRVRSDETSTVLWQLFQSYFKEGQIMPDMLEEFARETIDQILKELPIEKRLEGVPVEKLLEKVPVQKRLEGISVDQLVHDASPEFLRELKEKLRKNGDSAKPE